MTAAEHTCAAVNAVKTAPKARHMSLQPGRLSTILTLIIMLTGKPFIAILAVFAAFAAAAPSGSILYTSQKGNECGIWLRL